MGPPPKGTNEYKVYLKKQSARKRRATVEKRRSQKTKLVKPFVSAALRMQKAEHDKVVDELTRTKNKHFNEAAKLRSQVKELQFWKNRATQVTAENLSLNGKFQAATRKVKHLEAELKKAQADADETQVWRTWYSRVCKKASGKLLSVLNRWGFTRPPLSKDRGWGGGQ